MPPSTPPPESPILPPAPKPDNKDSKSSFYDKLLHWLFRLGLASIFLVNSLYAAFSPEEFTQLLYTNPITKGLGYEELMVNIVVVNDMMLAVLILIGLWKKFVYAWAGVWLLAVAGIKLINLVI